MYLLQNEIADPSEGFSKHTWIQFAFLWLMPDLSVTNRKLELNQAAWFRIRTDHFYCENRRMYNLQQKYSMHVLSLSFQRFTLDSQNLKDIIYIYVTS